MSVWLFDEVPFSVLKLFFLVEIYISQFFMLNFEFKYTNNVFRIFKSSG